MTAQFQSTLPGWGATKPSLIAGLCYKISIHAPRMGSDLPIRLLALPFAAFQSTLPGWGATGAKGDTGPTGVSVQ